MGTKWTEEQQKVIKDRDCSMLVAAAAGAGKTAVLVERIIRRILDEKNPIDIDRLLVVTFTNAAASEMRERIGNAISRELEKSPDSSRLQRQIVLLSKADITTIHSFCLEVIRNNLHMIDLDPAFRIADSTECVLLKQEVLEELFDSRYEEENITDDFLNLVECYGGSRDDRNLQDMTVRLYEFAQSTPWPEEWLYNMAEKFNVNDSFDFSLSPWARVIMDEIRIELLGVIDYMKMAVNILDGVSSLEAYYNHFNIELKQLEKVANCKDWNEMVKAFSNIKFDRLPSYRKGDDKDTQQLVKKIRDDCKKKINSIKDEIISADSKKIADEMRNLYPLMKCLSGLVVEFGERYRLKKKERGVIDFNDLEHYCIEILTAKDESGNIIPSDAALRYRKKFEEILVDEYQDSNMVQELILSVISRKDSEKPNLTMVGDVKQSIYRFRQAKPELFLEKYNRFTEDGRERKILLNKNFRSRAEILDASNYIFKSIMSQNLGEIEYSDKEKLNLGAEYKTLEDDDKLCGGPVELHLIESMKGEEQDVLEEDEAGSEEEEEDIDSCQLEARMAAQRINELVNGSGKKFVVYDSSIDDYRPVEYRDIVILMRSVAASAPVFMEELSKKGIPVYADTGSGYFEAIEIQVIMSMLQVIDNPMQDIPLLALLRSPIAAFTPDELLSIRMADGQNTFYEALIRRSMEDDDVGRKAASFLSKLQMWRKKSISMAVSELIWYLYNDTGYYAYVGAMPGGVQRQANLRILFERARQYEETSFKGLFNFISFINRLKKSSGDMGSAKTLGENENVVRIMSIHKSKGLEFPVVILSGAGKKFNLRDLNSSILFHHELGFGPDYVDSKRRISYPTIIKQALKLKMKLESYSEEMRILYVAFTRAKEKLIITGTIKDMEKVCKNWCQDINVPGGKVPEYQILKGNNFLDWICPALLKHSGCDEFRKSVGIQEISPLSMVEDSSKWDIKLWSREQVIAGQVDTEDKIVELEAEEGDARYIEEINRRLNFEYPYSMSSKLPTKLSVTELKRMFGTSLDDEYTQNIFVPPLIKKPLFLDGRGKISAAEKGTIMHLVMQHIDISKVPSEENIKLLMNDMVQQEFMTEEQKATVDIKKIVSFFESQLGERLLKSKRIYREVPFYMEIESTQLYKELPKDRYNDEKIVLQGIIDCYFEEDDGLVLIDYKTDRVDGISDSIKEKYRLQIEYYTKALERLTGKNVKEKYIYLFYNGEILSL